MRHLFYKTPNYFKETTSNEALVLLAHSTETLQWLDNTACLLKQFSPSRTSWFGSLEAFNLTLASFGVQFWCYFLSSISIISPRLRTERSACIIKQQNNQLLSRKQQNLSVRIAVLLVFFLIEQLIRQDWSLKAVSEKFSRIDQAKVQINHCDTMGQDVFVIGRILDINMDLDFNEWARK